MFKQRKFMLSLKKHLLVGLSKTVKNASKEKSVFRVFEAGAGRNPQSLINLARKSELKGKKREFTGVDLDLVNEGPFDFVVKKGRGVVIHLTAAEAEKLLYGNSKPKNLKLVKGSALEELKTKPNNHLNLIFGSFFINNLRTIETIEFLELAKAKLKPGGRLILIVPRIQLWVKDVGLTKGFRVHYRALTDAEAKKGPEFVAKRSTREGRKEYLEELKKAGALSETVIKTLMKEQRLTQEEELQRPVVVSLRKPIK